MKTLLNMETPRSRKGIPDWTAKEISLLDKLPKHANVRGYYEEYVKAVTKRGWPCRSINAVSKKAYLLGIDIFDRGQNFFASKDLVNTFGITATRAYRWRSEYGLKVKKYGKDYVVTRKDLANFLESHLDILYGIDPVVIAEFIGKPVKAVTENHAARTFNKGGYPCFRSDGKIYASITEAAEDMHCGKSTLQKAIKYGFPFSDYLWYRADWMLLPNVC